MNILLIALLLSFFQSPVTIVKNNGDELALTNVKIYQTEKKAVPDELIYNYRSSKGSISVSEIKRISFKEMLGKKKGITTYKVILVKKNNDKLEVDIDLVRIEGKNKEGKSESMNFSSVDKISF